MADFAFTFRPQWDAAGVRAFANEVRAAIRQIEAAAAGARGQPPLPPTAVQGRVAQVQAAAEQRLSSIQQSGALTSAQFAGLSQGIRADFERVARLYAAAATQGRPGTAGATGGDDRQARLDRLTETQQLQAQARRRARLLDRGLDEALAENRAAAEAAIHASDRAETLQRRAAQARLAAQREVQLDQQELQDRAEALITGRRNRGLVAGEVSGRPEAVSTLGAAAVQQGNLRARTQAAEASALLSSEEELRLRAEALTGRRAVAEAVGRQAAVEAQAAAAAVQSARAVEAQATRYAASSSRASDRRVEVAINQAGRAIEQSFRDREIAGRQAAAQARREVREAERLARARAAEIAAAEQAALAARARAAHATRFQEFQQAVASRTGREDRPASSFPTLSQAAASGFITTARFAVSGAVLYGALNTVQQLIRDASELERIFNQIERQFESADKAAQFPGFRQAIINIARETGQAVTEVAFVAFQMQGAFQNTTLAIEQTTAAIRLARVTGLELTELVDSLTGISQTYRDAVTGAPLPIEEIGDVALGLQERFGVLAKETLKATADLAPVAAEAGVPYRELAALIASIQQVSGRSGTAIAEGLGRVLPALQEISVDIVGLYSRTPQLAAGLAEVAAAAGQGDTYVILERLIRDFDKLDQAAQNYVITLLGGRREAQILNGIFGNTSRLIGELDRTQGDAGRTSEYFADLQETLAQDLARLGQVVEDLGQRLFEAGLGDILKDLVTVGGGVVDVLSFVARVMAEINDATGGAVGKVAELVVLLRALQALGTLALGRSIARAITGIGAEAALTGAAVGGAGFVGGRVAAGREAYQGARGRGLGRVVGGAGAALGAAGISPGFLATAAVAFAAERYLSAQAETEASAELYRESLEKLDADQIRRLRESGERKLSFWQNFWVDLPGGPAQTPDEISIEVESAKRAQPLIDQVQAAKEAGLTDKLSQFGITDKMVDEALKKSREGDARAILQLEGIIAGIRQGVPGGQAELDAAVNRFQSNVATQTATQRAETGEAKRAVDESRAAYESGAASGAEYLRVLDQELQNYATIRGQGDLLPDLAKKEAELQRERSKFVSERARALADYQLEILSLTGEGGPQAEVQVLTGLLRSGDVTDPKAREQVARDIVAAQKAILADEAAMADSAAEQLRILEEGIAIPDEARVVILEQALLNVDLQFRGLMDAVAASFGSVAELATRVATRAIQESISSMAALRAILNERIAFLAAQVALAGVLDVFGAGRDTDRIQEEIDRLTRTRDALPEEAGPAVPGGRVRGDRTERDRAREAAAREAEQEAKKAKDEMRATEQARFALLRAQAEGDPVRLAHIAIEEAQFLQAHAETLAESLTAQAQLVTAQNALARAQLQVGDAYRNIDRAMAEAAGDTVRVAQLELEQAREHLRAARERGDLLGGLEAEAAVITAQAGAIQAQIDASQRDTDFLLQMEKITTQQAIAQLEGLLQIPGITQEQTRSLLLKIHQLRRDVSRDLQFQVPSEIDLPTLYEVRRANQMAAVGAPNYQDNRQIGVQYIVNSAQDHERALSDLMNVLEGPRNGSTPRLYP